MMWSIQEATYVVTFEDDFEITCKCNVIENTHKIFNVEKIEHDSDWVDQYIILEDGSIHDVHSWEYCLDYCGDQNTDDWYWFK